MSQSRVIIIILLCIIVALLLSGSTIEALGGVLLLGLMFGAMIGAAFVHGEREPRT